MDWGHWEVRAVRWVFKRLFVLALALALARAGDTNTMAACRLEIAARMASTRLTHKWEDAAVRDHDDEVVVVSLKRLV
jgi:hypothetical protein